MFQELFHTIAALLIVIQSGYIEYEGVVYEREYSRLFSVSAYTTDYDECGKLPSDPFFGRTASGTVVANGRTVATDPKYVRTGSLIYIDGLGFRVAEDTGGDIKGFKVDCYMEQKSEAIQFGRRNLNVIVYKKAGVTWKELVQKNIEKLQKNQVKNQKQ